MSASAPTSSSRWLMKTIATPRSRSRRTVANRLSTSFGESAAVGSSMISSRALEESAFAISSSWRSATPSPRTGVSGPKSTPSSSRMPRRLSTRIARQSTVCRRLRGWRPAKTFSATRQIGEDGRLLVHRDDPEPVRGLRVADPLRLAVDQELAVVGLDDAGEDLHERRLAGAVLADERVHRARLDREADVGERPARRRSSSRSRAARRAGCAHRGYAAVTPPSTLMMFPVDFAERGPAKNAIASATSSG